MATEIERKFTVIDQSYREMAVRSSHIQQGYLSAKKEATVRVRIRDHRGYITVKGVNHGAERKEWEYEVPLDDAREMLGLSQTRVIDKTRYVVPFGGRDWEVDEFGGDLAPLVVAEVELPSVDAEVELPPFVGEEVTGDLRYYNSSLASTPRG